VEGATYCPRHGANKQLESQEKQAVHDYRLQKWQANVDYFAASPKVTTLRGEIGILRMMLEEQLNLCENQQDLLLYSHRISHLVGQIHNLVNTITKLEMKTGNFLDKSAALVLAGNIVDIIGRHVEDNKTVEDISSELLTLVTKLAGKEVEI
jgi:hypothetical protein